jgi:outer membrane protein assembly factor BamB
VAMKTTRRTLICALFLAVLFCLATASLAGPWPGWRGPSSNGISLEPNLPSHWDPAAATWKVEIAGQGHASPIVWGDRVCTATALPATKERMLVCLDRLSGKVLWQQTVVQGPLEKINPENSYASATPATDGQRVFSVFRSGDEIVAACHDLASGKQIWLVRPGTHVGEWGFSNEPVLFKDKVIIDADGKGDSFLIALNCQNGETAWRVDRKNRGISYSAPFIAEMAGRTQLIQCGDRCVTSFDPQTGQSLWRVEGPSEEFVATPTYSDRAGLVFVSSSWPKTLLLAIRPNGSGDVTATHVAWQDGQGASYVPSLLVAGDLLFSINNGGTAFCYEAATGKVLWREKLGRHHASPVLAAGLVFFINDNGQVNVIRPGRVFERVAQYELGESCYASPAISDGQVFIRGFKHLVCFGRKPGG